MPITQARMIALISAAQDYQRALDLVCEMIAAQSVRVETGQATLEQVCDVIFSSAQARYLLGDPIQSAVTIASEAHHFKLNKRRNERTAERQRVARGGPSQHRPQHSTTAPTAPLSAPLPRAGFFQQFAEHSTDAEQVQSDTQLDFHSPGEPSEEAKAEIAAASQFATNPGYSIPPSICSHIWDEPGETCRDCGERVP